MHHRSSLLLLSLLLSASAHAQLYKSVGPDGKITYSNSPPPQPTQAEPKPAAHTHTILPHELAEATRKHPVTLYTSANCKPCDNGRKALQDRGVPFDERTVQNEEDIAQLQRAGGSGKVPFLTVGAALESGFDPESWGNTLSAAGYPVHSQLPRTYHYPASQPAAIASNTHDRQNAITPGQ